MLQLKSPMAAPQPPAANAMRHMSPMINGTRHSHQRMGRQLADLQNFDIKSRRKTGRRKYLDGYRARALGKFPSYIPCAWVKKIVFPDYDFRIYASRTSTRFGSCMGRFKRWGSINTGGSLVRW